MTLAGRLIALFPLVNLAAAIASLVWFIAAPAWLPAAGFLFALYGLPVVAYRLLGLVSDLDQEVTRVAERRYAPWWGGHQTQLVYEVLPALESLMRVVPGLYAAWLRLWGSRIGRSVYFTPRVEIADRGLLDVGDGAFFGHGVQCFAHLVFRRGGELILYVKKIAVGRRSFLGGFVTLAAGVVIGERVSIGALCVIGLDVVIGDGATIGPGTRIAPGVRIAPGTKVPRGMDLAIPDQAVDQSTFAEREDPADVRRVA